jgi:hypothetical protein
MTFRTGRNGALRINDTTAVKVRDWSLETTVELINVNTIDSFANEFTPGMKGATGSATLIYYKGTADQKDFTDLLGRIVRTGRIVDGDDVILTLMADDEGASIRFRCFITSATVSVSNNELVVVPFNFTVNGDFNNITY